MHHPQQPSHYGSPHHYAPNSFQMHSNANPDPHYQGDGRAFVPPQTHTENVRNFPQQVSKKVIRVQDDPHHCDWAEKKIRFEQPDMWSISLSICVVGLLFIMVIQGTIQAMLVDKVYNGRFLDPINERA